MPDRHPPRCARCGHSRLDHAPFYRGGRTVCLLAECECRAYRSVLMDVIGGMDDA